MKLAFSKVVKNICYILLNLYIYTNALSNFVASTKIYGQSKSNFNISMNVPWHIQKFNFTSELSPIKSKYTQYNENHKDLTKLKYAKHEEFDDAGTKTLKSNLECKVVKYPLEYTFFKIIEISPRTSLEIFITHIDEDVTDFLVVQVHSQSSKIILGYDRIPVKGTFVNNSNAGLVIFLEKYEDYEANSTVYINNYHDHKLSVLLLIRNYTNREPIPGGFYNINSSIYLPHPYLFLDQNLLTTWVSFPLASLYPNITLSSSPNSSNIDPALIEPSKFIKYEVYLTYLYEGDLYEEHYWETVINTSTISRLKSNATKVSEIYGQISGNWIHELFVSYSGVGAVVNVVASYNNSEGVLYSSTVFYGCDFIKEKEYNCTKLVSSFAKLFCASLLFIGLILLFFGHRWLNFTMFISGFLSSWFILFVVFVHVHNPNIEVLGICTFLGALGGGVCWLVLWHKFHRPFYSALLIILLSSFFAAMVSTHFLKYAIVPTRHNLAAFIVFPILFCIAIIGYSVFNIKMTHIFSCCLLGSYGAMVPFAFYFGSSLTYIVINVVSEMTVRKFSSAVGYPPFQFCDIILLFVWIALFLFGIIYQTFRERAGPPFYPPNTNSIRAPLKAFSFMKEKIKNCLCRQPSDEDSLFEDRPRFFSRFTFFGSCNNEARERFSAYESFPRIGSDGDSFSLKEVVTRPFRSAYGFLRQRAVRLRQRLKGQDNLDDVDGRVQDDVEPLENRQGSEVNLETEFEEEPVVRSPLRGSQA